MRKEWIVLLALLLSSTLPLSASTFVGMTQQELVNEADTVVRGEVKEVRSFWTESGRLIATDVVVAVQETLIGESRTQVTVRTFGGQVGDLRVEAHGFPVFADGDQVFLFLEQDGEQYRVLGYQQGHFKVVTRLDGVTLAVPTIDEGVRLLSPEGRELPTPKSLEIGVFRRHLEKASRRAGREIR